MGCSGCETGRGNTNGVPTGCGNKGQCAAQGCNKFSVFDWLSNMSVPSSEEPYYGVEVRFKNDRKSYFWNVDKLPLAIGDAVAVESSPGHDIGTVSLTGELVKLQMSKRAFPESEMKKLYRKAKQTDIEKWNEAISLEKATLQKARKLAIDLGLEMKIGDVEYQGDRSKATFFYTANGRVDFRQLIKQYAEHFRIRVEMRQIGARQEASKLGGVGSCGRELCCSTWLTDFRTVNTSAARYQQLSLNPQKLAGQCGKLKCCLNYELDSYLDAVKEFPQVNTNLFTKKGEAYQVKTDIFKRILFYVYREDPSVFHAVPVSRVKEIIAMNRANEKPEDLLLIPVVDKTTKKPEPDYANVVGDDDLTRFDRKRGGGNDNRNRNRGGGGGNNNGNRRPQGQGQPQGPNPNRPRPSNNGPRPNNSGPRPNNNNGQRPNNNQPPKQV